MKTLGQIAYEAAAKVSFCDLEWADANQRKWQAAALAVAAAEREAAMRLLNHIEDVVDADNWERIDPKLWNAVTMRSNAELTGRGTGPND